MTRLPPIACLALLLPLAACGGSGDAVFENSADAFQTRAEELEAAADRDSQAAQTQAIAAQAVARNNTSAPAPGAITPVDGGVR
jgi:hypothetical protein